MAKRVKEIFTCACSLEHLIGCFNNEMNILRSRPVYDLYENLAIKGGPCRLIRALTI